MKSNYIELGAVAMIVALLLLLIGVVSCKKNNNEEPPPIVESLQQVIVTSKYGSDTIKLVALGGGTFTMGCTDDQGSECDEDEYPPHSVTLSSFKIGKIEVSQKLWKIVMEGVLPINLDLIADSTKGDNYPVHYISWYEIRIFLDKLNLLTGKRFRLPTEAEWEYAARGGNQSKGFRYSGSNNFAEVAWFYDDANGVNPLYRNHQVGTKKPNELGIYDMSGNVWEWCNDWYGPYAANEQTNPTGPNNGSSRVFRGGSWSYVATYCRVANRYYGNPDANYSGIGFRIALSE